MGLVSFAMTSMRELGNQHDVEAQLQEVTNELSQIQQLGSILADGLIEGHELDGIDYNNLEHLAFFQYRNSKTVGKELNDAFNFFKRQYPPQEQAMLRNYLMKSIWAEKGKQQEKILQAREKQLMMKKDKLEKRLKMIEANKKANDQGFDAAVKNFAPKFAGGQG